MLNDQLKLSFLSYLSDKGLIEEDKIDIFMAEERSLSFSQSSSDRLCRISSKESPSEEELDALRRYYAQVEPENSGEGFVELPEMLMIYEPRTDENHKVLLAFPGADYPSAADVVCRALGKIANTPVENIKQSSYRLLFDIVFILLPKSLFTAIEDPFRQLAVSLISRDTLTLHDLNSYWITGLGALVAVASCSSAFPRRKSLLRQLTEAHRGSP